jgi:hypothetical protein
VTIRFAQCFNLAKHRIDIDLRNAFLGCYSILWLVSYFLISKFSTMLCHICVFPKSRCHVDCILRHRHFRPLELIAQMPSVGKHIRIHKLSHFSKLSQDFANDILFDSIQSIDMQFWWIYISNCFWYEWFITYAYVQFDFCDYNLFKLQFDKFWQGS